MLRTIRDYVDLQAAERPDAVYLIAPETGRSLTFGALQQASRRLAAHLASCASPGDRVALLMENGYQTCRLFVGTMYAGYCVTPLNLLAQTSQLEYVLEHSDAKIVFVSPDQHERLLQALKKVARDVRVEVVDVDAEEFIEGSEEKTELDPVAEWDDALMMYTSGTTGKPKGVVLTNLSVISGGQFVSEAHALTPQDRVMACLPLYHINAQIVTATAPLVHGGSLVLPHRFGVTAYWSQVEKYGCTWVNMVPTMIAYLVNAAEQKEVTEDLSRVRFCRSASAPLPPSQHRAFEKKFGIGVIETMGLTETAAPCFTNPLDPAQRKIGSPGRAFGNEAMIIGPDGKQLAAGEVGEIMISGANVMKCYYKSPEQTAAAFSKNGWLHTGDLGYLDADGFVFVTGRIKELIIKGGENIAPREIDEALLKHPAVLDAAAVGIEDPNYGQEIMACVVLKEGATCTVEELRAFAEQELGRYKTPKIFHFLADLPRGPSGKVQRLKLLDVVPQAKSETHAPA